MNKSSVVFVVLLLISIGLAQIPLSAAKAAAGADASGKTAISDFDRAGLNRSTASGTEGETIWEWNSYCINGTDDYVYLRNGMARVIVKLEGEDARPRVASVATEANGSVVNEVHIDGKGAAVVAEVPLEKVDFFVSSLGKVGRVEYAEPNMKFRTAFTPNDEYWDLQWNMQIIQADWAWNTTLGDPSVLVAVVDTGIDYTHPDLSANYAPLGYDWVNNDTDPIDDNGHGTHCAGIIAAMTNNRIGVAGLAQVRVMAEKGLDYYGMGYTDQLAQAIVDAVDKGAKIISMSWGSYFDSELIHEAIAYAYDHQVLLVAAAGNDYSKARHYPASYDEVVAVSATTSRDRKEPFSNYGDWIELSAPGSAWSTISQDHSSEFSYPYCLLSGTSMACPHVAGVAALILSRFPNTTRDQLRARLWYSTDDLGDRGFDIYYGYGRINARKAVEEAFPEHGIVITRWEPPPYVEPGHDGVVRATLFNFGKSDEKGVSIGLLANNTSVRSVTVSFLASMQSLTVNLSWTPLVEARYNMTVFAVPVAEQTLLLRNAVWTYVDVGFPLKAAVLHSYGTWGFLTVNWDNLDSNWRKYGDTLIYIDYTALDKENITYNDLLASNADVLIISCAYSPEAGWEFSDSEVNAIKEYVMQGHGLIATAGTLCFTVPNNNKLASLFGLSESTRWTIASALNERLELMVPFHPLFRNIPNPFGFVAMQSAIPVDSKWSRCENAGGIYVALGPNREAAIVTYKGLVYISTFLDGIIFEGDDFQYSLQLFYNAITWSRYQKQENDLSAFLESPAYVRPGETVCLNVTVSNRGSNDETDVVASLLVNGTIIDNRTVGNLSANSSITYKFVWTAPDVEATCNVSAYVYPVSNESDVVDNLNVKILEVTRAPVIGIIYSHGDGFAFVSSQPLSFPDYCRQLGYVVQSIYEEPVLNALNKCDIIAIGSYGSKPWSSAEIDAVRTCIDFGKGFLAIGDFLSTYVQEILQEYGISYTGTGARTGYSVNFDFLHPIMRGLSSVYVTPWPPWGEITFNSLRVASPAYWIANDSSNENVVIAASEMKGRVLCLCSNFADYTLSNSQMFKNILAWMTGEPKHEICLKVDIPEFTKPNVPVQTNATIVNYGSVNETSLEAFLLVDGVEAKHVLIPSLPVHSRLELNFSWTPPVKEIYNVTAFVPAVLGENFTDNNVAAKFVFVSDVTARLLSIRPALQSVMIGSTFVANVTINNVADLYEWQIALRYDPALLEFQDVIFPADNVFVGKPVFRFPDLTGGCLYITCMMTADTPGVTVLEGTLCQIKLKAKVLGESALEFDAEGTSVQDSKVQRISCSVQNATVTVKINQFDLHQDGKVDLKDLAIVAKAFGSIPLQPRWNPIADIDDNGIVNLKDLALVAANIGK